MDDPAFDSEILAWLQRGDVSIAYQVGRDLLRHTDPALRARIANEGWGARLLTARHANGVWGQRFYQPKWTSSHYSLLDLRTLEIDPGHPLVRASIAKILAEERKPDGGIGPARSVPTSDVCVNGMFLNYSAYFGTPEGDLKSVVDFVLAQQMEDGGFNCLRNSVGATHSSLHSSLSVAEGIESYASSGYTYRTAELQKAAVEARDFMLRHRLFRSQRTGEIISRKFLQLNFPPRWKFNILRALDHFRAARHPWDPRLADAMLVLAEKRGKDGRWRLAAAHPGQVHFAMEKAGEPSRWNTLLALRVMKAYAGALAVSAARA